MRRTTELKNKLEHPQSLVDRDVYKQSIREVLISKEISVLDNMDTSLDDDLA